MSDDNLKPFCDLCHSAVEADEECDCVYADLVDITLDTAEDFSLIEGDEAWQEEVDSLLAEEDLDYDD